MTAAELTTAIQLATEQVNQRLTERDTQRDLYEQSVLALAEAQSALSSLQQQTPDPEPSPSLPAPEIQDNNDGTFTILPYAGAKTEVWLWEVQTQGWQGLVPGVTEPLTAEHQGREVMARYWREGPGGEHTEDGPITTVMP
jgi:hypothetical protein